MSHFPWEGEGVALELLHCDFRDLVMFLFVWGLGRVWRMFAKAAQILFLSRRLCRCFETWFATVRLLIRLSVHLLCLGLFI